MPSVAFATPKPAAMTTTASLDTRLAATKSPASDRCRAGKHDRLAAERRGDRAGAPRRDVLARICSDRAEQPITGGG
jgi:hypothetical protein